LVLPGGEAEEAFLVENPLVLAESQSLGQLALALSNALFIGVLRLGEPGLS